MFSVWCASSGLYDQNMSANRSKFLAAAISVLMITGCASEVQGSSETETTKVSEEFLNITSDAINAKDKANFESLVFEEDKFTKEASLDLPKGEVAEFKLKDLNDLQVEFSLLKPSGEKLYFPLMTVAYTGDDWLFMESTIIKVKDDVINVSPIQSPAREAVSGAVIEIIAFELDKKVVNLLGESESNSDLDIRIVSKYDEDIKLTSLEYKGMKKIISAYRYYLTTLK